MLDLFQMLTQILTIPFIRNSIGDMVSTNLSIVDVDLFCPSLAVHDKL